MAQQIVGAEKKVAAGILGILLGGLGIHKFVLGYTGAGITMLLVTILTLGIGGVVTWPDARRLPEVVRTLPAAALVLETDAPYMTPEPHRAESNRPAYLVLVAEKVAKLRNWSVEETIRVTTENARRLFRL